MNDLVKLAKKNPLLVIGTAAVVGLALGTGVIPLPSRPAPAPAAATAPPAAPPAPTDPMDAY